MNATPPEAKIEYSRGPRPSGPVFAGRQAPPSTAAGAIRTAILAGGLLGALLLIAAEFTALFEVHAATSSRPVASVSTGSHQSYALVPIALLVAALACGVWREGSRIALLATGLLGVIALLIALLGDLPDTHATGLIGSSTTRYADANSTAGAGLYLETLGAVVLVITCVSGFLTLGAPAKLPRPGRAAAGRGGDSATPAG
jgi:hypothetical protein